MQPEGIKLTGEDEIILIDTLGTTGDYLVWDNFKISSSNAYEV